MKKRVLFLLSCAALTFSACDSKTTNDNDLSISGKAIDGYLTSSTICIDMNRDDSCEDEATQTSTDDSGSFSLAIPNSELDTIKNKKVPLLAYGGIDSDTNKEYIGKLKAIMDPDENEINITPISSVVFSSYKNGASIEDAHLQTAASLGLRDADLRGDYIANKNYDAQSAALTLQKTLEVLHTSSNDISIAYDTLGKETANTTDIIELLSKAETNSSTKSIAQNVKKLSDAISKTSLSKKDKKDVFALLNENLETIKALSSGNNSQLKSSFNSLVNAIDANDINGSLKYNYANKLLLNAAVDKAFNNNVNDLISKIDVNVLADLNANADAEEIINIIDKKNPGFLKVTITTLGKLLATSGITIASDYFTLDLFNSYLKDGNISRVLSPKAFLEFAISNSSDLFSKIVKNSESLKGFFSDEPNSAILAALLTANSQLPNDKKLSTSTLNTLASIKLTNGLTESSLLTQVTSLFATDSGGFINFILDFILPSSNSSSSDSSFTHTLIIKAIVTAANSFGYQISDSDAEQFFSLNTDITVGNIANYYTTLKTFLDSKKAS